MSSSSCNRVLGGIPELLEKVLLELPPRDLLLAQRISKTFRDSIQASTRIQQKLFFKAAPPMSLGRAVNPFLPLVANRDPRWACGVYITQGGVYRKQSTLIPTTEHLKTTINRFLAPDNILTTENVDLTVSAAPSDTSHHSWRKMLVVDPICRMEVQSGCHKHYASCKNKLCNFCFVYRDILTMTTMGDVANALEDLYQHWLSGEEKVISVSDVPR